MKNVIITGATSMVGSMVLKECVKSSEISKITSVVRRPSGIVSEKLTEIIHDDFIDFSSIEDNFKNRNIAFFCLGVYTGQVSDVKFKEITVDFTVSFSNTLKRHSPATIFCFLSGQGADSSEKSRISFARYKGMSENYLLKNISEIYIFRPSYIYPVKKREEPNFLYRLMRNVYPLLKIMGSKLSVVSSELAHVMFCVATKGGNQTVYANNEILKILQ